MAKELMPNGILTINEMREIMELAPVEGGDKRLVTLNVVDTDIANEYQLGKNGKENKNDKSDNKEDEPAT
jgi:hypothetical protein